MAQPPRLFDRKTFQEWKANRLNQTFFQYLKDQRAKLAEEWASGQTMDMRHQTKALLLGELESLSFEDFAAFYGIPTDETESGAS
jgi:hypothetical protein